MNYSKYYSKNKTYIKHRDYRLDKIICIISSKKYKRILDIGSGDGYLLEEMGKKLPASSLTGIDVYPIRKKGINFKTGDITKGLPFANDSFDCAILGEVIEHVPDPDFILREVKRVLSKNGTLIISTPNLVSWANRIMVLLGLQPFYTETSTEMNLGRGHKILGQGCKVQGHLKIFTHKSLEEILIKEKFNIISKYGVPFFFPFPISLIDRFFIRFLPFASGLLYVCQK